MVAYGTKIYAVGGLAGYEGAGDYRDTWMFNIMGTREWMKGPRLQSGKFVPISFSLDQRLCVLDSLLDTIFDKNFKLLDLQAGEKDMSWRPLDFSDFVGVERDIRAVAIHEKANRVYMKSGNGDY